MIESLKKSKASRIAIIVGPLVLAAGLYAGIGRLIGHGVDKLIDHVARS